MFSSLGHACADVTKTSFPAWQYTQTRVLCVRSMYYCVVCKTVLCAANYILKYFRVHLFSYILNTLKHLICYQVGISSEIVPLQECPLQ